MLGIVESHGNTVEKSFSELVLLSSSPLMGNYIWSLTFVGDYEWYIKDALFKAGKPANWHNIEMSRFSCVDSSGNIEYYDTCKEDCCSWEGSHDDRCCVSRDFLDL
jgi:hypothetical protein